MAITKNPLIRYKILDKCFRNPYKNFYFETLLEAVNEMLFEITGDEEGIKTRQLRDDIAFMRSSEGWNIELAELSEGKKKIYRYEDVNFSINNAPLNEVEMDQFQSAIQVLSQFEGMPQFEGIQAIIAKLKTDLKTTTNQKPFIGFDSSQDLKGIEHFSTLYNAVQNKTPLEIRYKDFKSEEPYTYIFHPYYLKEYNNRWFLFGLHPESGKPDWNVVKLDNSAIQKWLLKENINPKTKKPNGTFSIYLFVDQSIAIANKYNNPRIGKIKEYPKDSFVIE